MSMTVDTEDLEVDAADIDWRETAKALQKEVTRLRRESDAALADPAIELFYILWSGDRIGRNSYPGHWVSSSPSDHNSYKLPEHLQVFLNELEPLNEKQRAYIESIDKSNNKNR